MSNRLLTPLELGHLLGVPNAEKSTGFTLACEAGKVPVLTVHYLCEEQPTTVRFKIEVVEQGEAT